jgi:hypothetical protein
MIVQASDMIYVDQMNHQEREELCDAFRVLSKQFPTMFCGLNVAQFRIFTKMYTPLEDYGTIPHVCVATPGNGVGKTQSLGQDVVGWTCGSKFLKTPQVFDVMEFLRAQGQLLDMPHGLYFPQVALDFYDSVADMRDSGMLPTRIVCDAEDMKADGSVYMTLKEWIPSAKFTASDNTKVYRQVIIPHPEKDRVDNKITIKTFNQETRKHSGSNLKRVWINEPMPEGNWSETAARTRSKKGETPGTIGFFATVMNQAPYVSDIIENPRNVHVGGACWENCVGEEVTDEMAREVEVKIGVTLKKNPEGRGYMTFGFLTRESIEQTLADFSPDEYDARKFGTFMHLEGRVFNLLVPDVHFISKEVYSNIPENYPVVQVCDPHLRRPDYSAWFLICPGPVVVCIAEYPTYESAGCRYFEAIKKRSETIEEICEIWRRIESELGIAHQVVARVGDPNMFLNPHPGNNQTLQYEYAKNGFRFNTTVNDDIKLGLEEVNKYLRYNKALREHNTKDPLAQPSAFFTSAVKNMKNSLLKWAWKEKRDTAAPLSEQLGSKFEAPAAVFRYLVMWLKGKNFNSLKPENMGTCSDYEKVKQGRIPRSRRQGPGQNVRATRVFNVASAFSSKRRTGARR